MLNNVGPMLRVARNNKGVPLKSLVDSSLTVARLRAIERGENVTREQVLRICGKLGVNPGHVLGELDDREAVRTAYGNQIMVIEGVTDVCRRLVAITVLSNADVSNAKERLEDDRVTLLAGGLVADGEELQLRSPTGSEIERWVGHAVETIKPGGFNADPTETKLGQIDRLRMYTHFC